MEAAASLGWLLVAAFAIYLFKGPISALLSRLRSVSREGTTLDFELPAIEVESNSFEHDNKEFSLLAYKVAHMAGHFWLTKGNFSTAITEYFVGAQHAKAYGEPLWINKCLGQIRFILEISPDVEISTKDDLVKFCNELPPESLSYPTTGRSIGLGYWS